MSNKNILLIMTGVFTILSCKFIMFLIPISLCLIILATTLYFEYAKEQRIKNNELSALTERMTALEEKFKTSSLKLMSK